MSKKQFDGQRGLFDEELNPSEMTDKQYVESLEILNRDMLNHLREKNKQGLAFFIPGNTPSLKNGKEISQLMTKSSVCCQRKGGLMVKDPNRGWICSVCDKPAQRYTRPSLIKNKRVMEHENTHKDYFTAFAQTWKRMIKDKCRPYYVGMYFIRDSFRDYDYVNACQIIQDMMVTAEYLTADCAKLIKPFFLGYHVNTKNAGCIVTLMDRKLFELEMKGLE